MIAHSIIASLTMSSGESRDVRPQEARDSLAIVSTAGRLRSTLSINRYDDPCVTNTCAPACTLQDCMRGIDDEDFFAHLLRCLVSRL